MNIIGRVLLKSIYNNLWVKIEYHNQNDKNTTFLIGVKDIYPSKRMIKCDSFNIAYSYDTEERTIYFDSILTAQIVEKTYHPTSNNLIEKIEENKEKYYFLFDNAIVKSNILNYYIDCYKLDSTPYISKYTLVPGIDDEVLVEKGKYYLDNERFNKLVNSLISKKKKLTIDQSLAMNIISINTNKGLYVLAYRELYLNIEEKALVPTKNIIINKEFSFNMESGNVKDTYSINQFIGEDDLDLLDDFENNVEAILEALHEYNNTKHSSYKREIKVDNRPFIINLERKYSIDMISEINKINETLDNNEEGLPLKVFFGEIVKLNKRQKYPIFTIDNKFNIDQVNAIYQAFRSPVSYIQGPPGTGKSQTILNAIFTALFNNKTVLVTSNNNIPIDGLYHNILDLEYEGNKILLPVVRLGSRENLKEAILRIREMYNSAANKKVNESQVEKIKNASKAEVSKLADVLDKYDEYIDLLDRERSLNILKENTNNSMFNIQIDSQIDSIKKRANKYNIDIENINKYISNDYEKLYLAIHLETITRLNKLNRDRYRPILNAIMIKDLDDAAKSLRDFLANSDNLERFQEIFPVILSTNLSCTYLGEAKPNFDLVMMDESGQCNVCNALIPIVRARQLILVGDPQQLKPVILLDKNVNNRLKEKYKISSEYDYLNNSIYILYTSVDIINNETLLSYHYRSNKDIIEFSNNKYYNKRLKVKTKSLEDKPLLFVNTASVDDNTEKNISDVEAKYVCDFIKQNEGKTIGVITPFVKQKQCIEFYLKEAGIKNVSIGTVHEYQGEQKDVIIFSTAITKATQKKTFNWFKNNNELINVGVTRAKDKLIVLGNEDVVKEYGDKTDDICELFEYVKTNGQTAITSKSISSVALGTRQISTESEKELAITINQILSVINNYCYIKTEVKINSIFKELEDNNSLFYTGSFDLVVFQKAFMSRDKCLLVVELNGPEHDENIDVKKRDEMKRELCASHNIKLISIRRDYARDYIVIKKALIDFIGKK